MAYWERLAEILDREPVQERDRVMMAMLRPPGIEKGQPFRPDARQTKILTDAALAGEAMANDFERRNLNMSPNKEGVHWQVTLCLDVGQEAEFYTQLDERAAYFYEGGPTTRAMVTTTPGIGQAYLSGYKDKDGNWLDGSCTYRLHVLPNPPVKQFWLITVYDVSTRFLINNPQKIADHSSRQRDLVRNPDGSVDIYVGPTAPKGFEKNWIPRMLGKAWFAWFRLYAPLEPFFDKSWPVQDFEKVN